MIQGVVGNRFSDFTSWDDRGVAQDIGRGLGDFTVLVLSECAKNPHGPVSKDLVDPLHAEQKSGSAETGAYDVDSWKDSYPDHGDRDVLESGRCALSMCKVRSYVRALYSVDTSDKISVIGPDQRIVTRTPGSDFEMAAVSLSSMFHDDAVSVAQQRWLAV